MNSAAPATAVPCQLLSAHAGEKRLSCTIWFQKDPKHGFWALCLTSLSQLWSHNSCKNPDLPWPTTQSCKTLETALCPSHCQVLSSAQELPGQQHWFALLSSAILLFTRHRYEKQIWDPIYPPVNSAAAKSTPEFQHLPPSSWCVAIAVQRQELKSSEELDIPAPGDTAELSPWPDRHKVMPSLAVQGCRSFDYLFKNKLYQIASILELGSLLDPFPGALSQKSTCGWGLKCHLCTSLRHRRALGVHSLLRLCWEPKCSYQRCSHWMQLQLLCSVHSTALQVSTPLGHCFSILDTNGSGTFPKLSKRSIIIIFRDPALFPIVFCMNNWKNLEEKLFQTDLSTTQSSKL